MLQVRELPWEKIHHFLLASGSIRDPRELSVQIVRNIYALIPYDQARVYFINDNGKIYDEVLFGADKRWSKIYIEYFSQLENGRYNIASDKNSVRLGIHDWSSLERSEFITDYIKPQGLHYSTGFSLSDVNNHKKCCVAFDRVNRSSYTEDEMATMRVIKAHVDNLHKNLFVLSSNTYDRFQKQGPEASLSRRESEIAELLCEGVTPANIGKKLCLSISTVYRHIANIHSKLGVSNRQELLIKLLNQSDNANASPRYECVQGG